MNYLDIIQTLPGWTSQQKATFLHNLILSSNAKVVVEIGSFAMQAGIPMAAAVKQNGGRYYGIDPYKTEPCLEGTGNADNDKYWIEMDWEKIKMERDYAIKKMGLGDVINFMEVTSREAVNYLRNGEGSPLIDLLYIDGNFTEENSLEDVTLYAPEIKIGGYVVINNSDWNTKAKARKRILELGFKEIGTEHCCGNVYWTTYQKVEHKEFDAAKVDVAPMDYAKRLVEVHPTLEGWSSLKQCQTLFELVVKSNAKVSVELGVFGGRGMFAMALAHKLIGQGKCFGIDPWIHEACIEGSNDVENDEWWKSLDLEALYVKVAQLMINENLTEQSSILRLKSQEAWCLFTNIDVLFCDGNHSEEISCNDVAQYCPLIRKGGYLMFDDASWPTTQKAQELILNYGFIEIMKVDEGDGREWKVYRKLGWEEVSDTTVNDVIKESEYTEPTEVLNQYKETYTIERQTEAKSILEPGVLGNNNLESNINPVAQMNDPQSNDETRVDIGKEYPIYDPSKKQPCHPVPSNSIDAGLTSMIIGGLNIKPILGYIPDTPYFVERWKRSQEHFKEAGLTNILEVPLIHGQAFGITGTHSYDRDNPGTNYYIGPGYTAQFLSVYMLYNIAHALPHEYYLFLECDARLAPNFLNDLSEELQNVPSDFDWLFAGSCCAEGKLNKHIKGKVYQFDQSTSWPFCGHAFIVARKALPYIISTQRDTYASSDLSLCYHTFPNLKVFGIIPRLSDQFENTLHP